MIDANREIFTKSASIEPMIANYQAVRHTTKSGKQSSFWNVVDIFGNQITRVVSKLQALSLVNLLNKEINTYVETTNEQLPVRQESTSLDSGAIVVNAGEHGAGDSTGCLSTSCSNSLESPGDDVGFGENERQRYERFTLACRAENKKPSGKLPSFISQLTGGIKRGLDEQDKLRAEQQRLRAEQHKLFGEVSTIAEIAIGIAECAVRANVGTSRTPNSTEVHQSIRELQPETVDVRAEEI